MIAILSKDHSKFLYNNREQLLIVKEDDLSEASEFKIVVSRVARYRCECRGIIPVCYVEKADVEVPDDEKFTAYFCPYAENTIKTISVNPDRDYVLTPTLSGCSIGIQPTNDPNRFIMSHANAQYAEYQNLGATHSYTGTQDLPLLRFLQQREQENLLLDEAGINRISIFHPPQMGQPRDNPGNLRTTLIGELDENREKWRFVAETYISSEIF